MSQLYLIEDHLLVREGLRVMLETAQYRIVGESSDPTQAVHDLVRLAPEVLLLDLMLGTRSGFEVMTELKRRNMRVRTVVLTMSAQPRHVAEAMRLGAWGYVLKTAPIVEVTKGIEAVLQGQRFLGSGVNELAVQALTHEGEADNPIDKLSPRERQIITLVVNGRSSSKIGDQLHLSARTVDTYRSRLMSKVGVHDVPSLVRLAIRNGLIDLE